MKKQKEKAKQQLEDIIKKAEGVAPTLMARGNYGRLLMKQKVANHLIQAMPDQVMKGYSKDIRLLFGLMSCRTQG